MIEAILDPLNNYHHFPLQFRTAGPGAPLAGGAVLQQLNPAPGRQAARPGVASASFLAYRPHGQRVGSMPAHAHVGLDRVDDRQAARAWRAAAGALSDCVDRGSLRITCWDALTPRITKDQSCTLAPRRWPRRSGRADGGETTVSSPTAARICAGA